MVYIHIHGHVNDSRAALVTLPHDAPRYDFFCFFSAVQVVKFMVNDVLALSVLSM